MRRVTSNLAATRTEVGQNDRWHAATAF